MRRNGRNNGSDEYCNDCTGSGRRKTNRYGDFEYQINGSEVTITKYVGDDSSVYIPDYIDGRKVTQISHSAFALLDELQNSIEFIRLPAYLEEIEEYSFMGTNLKSIVFRNPYV